MRPIYWHVSHYVNAHDFSCWIMVNIPMCPLDTNVWWLKVEKTTIFHRWNPNFWWFKVEKTSIFIYFPTTLAPKNPPFQAPPFVPAAPAAPAVGGPPVGLGGPGNLAALNKKASASTEWMVGGWIRWKILAFFLGNGTYICWWLAGWWYVY